MAWEKEEALETGTCTSNAKKTGATESFRAAKQGRSFRTALEAMTCCELRKEAARRRLDLDGIVGKPRILRFMQEQESNSAPRQQVPNEHSETETSDGGINLQSSTPTPSSLQFHTSATDASCEAAPLGGVPASTLSAEDPTTASTAGAEELNPPDESHRHAPDIVPTDSASSKAEETMVGDASLASGPAGVTGGEDAGLLASENRPASDAFTPGGAPGQPPEPPSESGVASNTTEKSPDPASPVEAEDKPLEKMTMRELKSLASKEGVNLDGHFTKDAVISELRACLYGEPRATAEQRGYAAGREPANHSKADLLKLGKVSDGRQPPGAEGTQTVSAGGVSRTAGMQEAEEAAMADLKYLESLTMRELKKVGAERGIDVKRCLDKPSMVRMLRRPPSASTTSMPSDVEEERKASQARQEAERNARLEAEKKAKADAERAAEAERERRRAAEEMARQEADRKAKEEAERKRRLQAEEEEEAKRVAARQEAERTKRLEAEERARREEEASRKAREEAEAKRKAQEEAEIKARLETEQKARKDVQSEASNKPATPGTEPSTDYGTYKISELKAMATQRGIDLHGCVDKADIIDCLKKGAPLTKGATKGFATKKPATKAAPKAAAAKKSQAPPQPPPVAKAPAPAPAAPAAPSSAGYSSRITNMLDQYPGFTACLCPELETWTNQELEVYFGSNGDIWPKGTRPVWMKKPSFQSEDRAPKAKPPDQLLREFPELKQMFETLDLTDTTRDHDLIRRTYRRLARDRHPDKHPDDLENATEQFRKLNEAYEGIRQRLRMKGK